MLDITYQNYLANPKQILKQLRIHHIESFEKYLQLGPNDINDDITKLKNMTYHLRDIYVDQQKKNLEFSKQLHENYLAEQKKNIAHEKNSGLLKNPNSNNIFSTPNPIIKINPLITSPQWSLPIFTVSAPIIKNNLSPVHAIPLSTNHKNYFNKPPANINFRDKLSVPPKTPNTEKGKLTFVTTSLKNPDETIPFKSNSVRSFEEPTNQPVLKKPKLNEPLVNSNQDK
jgi:hypothetical protein